MKKTKDVIWPLLGIIIFLLIWQITAAFIIKQQWLLPDPISVIISFGENIDLLWKHSLFTLAEAASGMVISVLLAVIFALIMSMIPRLQKMLYPLLLISQMIPVIVLAPLFVIWFGYGMLPKVLVVILICFFPMTINTLAGLNATDEETAAFFRTMGMNKSQLFRLVRLPYALPYFFSGLRISAVYSVMGAVIGEWLGAANGLGILLIRAQSSFDLELVFAAILAIIIWSSLIFALVRLAENKALSWQKYQREEKWDAAGF